LKESTVWVIAMDVKLPHSEDSLATRASLLQRLKDSGDHQSWQAFFDRYWQVIYRVALKSGLTESEAQDAVQETVIAVAKNIRAFEYDPGRCSFKSWLMLITRQRIIWQLRKRLPLPPTHPTDGPTSRTSTIDKMPDENALKLDAMWEEEWRNNLMSAALERVKTQTSPRQYQIFDLYVLQNWPAADVAHTLRISMAQIYLAKHRVSNLLKNEVKRLDREQ
jgi:RNA polymerase sigma factor (sigma-70 family)